MSSFWEVYIGFHCRFVRSVCPATTHLVFRDGDIADFGRIEKTFHSGGMFFVKYGMMRQNIIFLCVKEKHPHPV